MVVTDAFNDVDDVVALYALSKSAVRCAGIVTTYGNERTRAKAVSKFLRMADVQNVPVYYSKVWESRFQAPNDMNETGYGFLSESELLAGNKHSGINSGGEKFIADSINSDAGGISVLSIAPLTALAHAMRSVKPQNCGRIYVMGGHIGAYDNTPNTAYNHAQIPEYNFTCDPAAVKNVLASGAEVFVVGKNLWTKDLFSLEDFGFLEIGTPVQRELFRMIKLRHEHNKKIFSPRGIDAEVFMYDPITLGAVLFPELYEFRRMDVEVDDTGVTHATFSERGNIQGAVGADLAQIKKKAVKHHWRIIGHLRLRLSMILGFIW